VNGCELIKCAAKDIVALEEKNAKLTKMLDDLLVQHDPNWPSTAAERDRTWQAARKLMKEVK